MAGEEEGTATAAATPAAAPAPAPTGPLELGLHAAARALQLQHGLRHGDYQRYRRYCTRRLRRLRVHAKLTHSHGAGSGRGGGGHRSRQPQPFQARQLLPAAATPPTTTTTTAADDDDDDGGGGGETQQQQRRPPLLKAEHLLLALLGAERSWALAMQLKQDHAGGKGMPSHVRAHVIRRLRRAAWWGGQLKALVAAAEAGAVTERTALEAEAYAAGMAALLALEQEKWEEALGGLRVAHSILGRFAEMPGASLHDQDLFALK
jgi:signal recognition particle subunit SRP68